MNRRPTRSSAAAPTSRTAAATAPRCASGATSTRASDRTACSRRTRSTSYPCRRTRHVPTYIPHGAGRALRRPARFDREIGAGRRCALPAPCDHRVRSRLLELTHHVVELPPDATRDLRVLEHREVQRVAVELRIDVAF